MCEIWRSVSGFDGYYEVSNFGRVRSVDRYIVRKDGVTQKRAGVIKKQAKNNDGYLTVHLSKEGCDKRVGVHILVAKAFVSGYFDGAEVNHIDCNRENNVFSNLEWITHADNVRYAIKQGNHVCVRNISGSNNPNFGNHKLHDIYAADKELAKVKQGRCGKANGMATSVRMFIGDDTVLFSTIRECAEYMIEHRMTRSANINCVSIHISKAAKTHSPYRGLMFEF